MKNCIYVRPCTDFVDDKAILDIIQFEKDSFTNKDNGVRACEMIQHFNKKFCN